MLVVFRADASVQIGTGHVMRCLTLADELTRHGHSCRFICREHPGHLGDLIASKGFRVDLLPARNDNDLDMHGGKTDHYATWLGVSWEEDARETLEALSLQTTDWLVVDHYALDVNWERLVGKAVSNVMVIDDLANRAHECALLMDQNLGRVPSDYDDLLPEECSRLIGPRYALLRPEFSECRDRGLKHREQPELKRILISLGGVDQANVTGRVLDGLSASALPASTELDIILGASAPFLAEVQQQAARMRFKATVSVNVKDMAERMYLADLSIGAAGGTSWERCSLGLPAVLVVLAENQVAGAKALLESGAAKTISDPEQLASLLPSVLAGLAEPGLLYRMSESAAGITDGKGVLRVVKAMSAISRGGEEQ